MHKIISLLALMGMLLGLSACGGNPSKTLSGKDKDAVLAYSESIADNLLKGVNDADYSTFSRDFDANMAKALPKSNFPQLETQITGKIGKYVSRQVDSVIETGTVETVVYKAKFEQDDPVTVTLALHKDEPHQVTGLWFNSAKLAGK